MWKTIMLMAGFAVMTVGLAACKPEQGKQPARVMEKVGEQLGAKPDAAPDKPQGGPPKGLPPRP